MGIWYEAKIICGCEIDMSDEMLENIKNYDPEFNINIKEEYGKWHDYHYAINAWLKEHFPDITIENTYPRYDCDGDDVRYFLTFESVLGETLSKSSIKDVISLLESFNVDNYTKVFKIMFPDDECEEPKIFSVPHIW